MKTSHDYPKDNFREQEKYLPSIFFEVEIDKQMIKAEARPLRRDVGYYTINLNNVFLAHIHKVDEKWVDFLRVTNEIYEAVGKMIEQHLNNG